MEHPEKNNLLSKRFEAIPVSERYWWKIVAFSFFGWILMYADRTILNPVMGNIAEQFNLSNAQLGLVNSVFFLSYAATQIPFGALGDKIGRKVVISVGFILFGITTYFSGVVSAFGVFMIFRAITGIGEAAYYGPQYALSTESIPTKKLTLGTAIINSGMAFGTSGGYLLSSKLVLENGAHWSQPFIIMSIPTVLFGILFFFFIKEKVVRPEDQHKMTLQNAKDQTNNLLNTKPSEKLSFMTLIKNRNLLCAFILCFCSIYANFVIITWLPRFLQVERGFAGTSVGFISSLVPWASIPGALLLAYLSDKYKVTKKFVFALVPLALISTFGIAFVTDRTLLIAVLILYGLTGKLALDPILVAFVTKNAPKSSLSTTLSAYNFVGMSGSILAPYVTGFLADQLGSMKVGFYLAAGLLLIGMIVFSFSKEEQTNAA
ncbi:MFS transporter [Acidaminobacter hydrogenoformans]|uniref:Sugar phosphate permease n=1 Tax=Acidaminobacter hydrogenoformans DSM 2784 TaxID=1120920 RepID=A0A1G5S0D8_9FIRM|nr:MFS transporter [Acidaminobacter hydrogenoformans]SCZ79607.1 Sugar phosphate permease [Acidaminobacter hydrogenoformans DSM 2784]